MINRHSVAQSIKPTDWEFVRADLIKEVNGTDYTTTEDEGLLSVTFANKNSKGEIRGTVCADNFNWGTANTICHYFGYEQGEWNSKNINTSKFLSE